MKGILTLIIGGLLAVGCATTSDFPTETTSSTSPPTTVASTTTSSVPAEPVVVFVVEEDGGCMMMGPNCAGYRFFSDGTVEVYRTDPTTAAPAAEIDGSIDPGLVTDVTEALAAADISGIRAALAPGECRGCYDGIDTTFRYETIVGTVPFASTEVELDLSVPLFAATVDALEAAKSTLDPLEVVSR